MKNTKPELNIKAGDIIIVKSGHPERNGECIVNKVSSFSNGFMGIQVTNILNGLVFVKTYDLERNACVSGDTFVLKPSYQVELI